MKRHFSDAVGRAGFILLMLFFILLAMPLTAQDQDTGINARASILGGVGISVMRGDYVRENSGNLEFSFYPGARLELMELFFPGSLFLIDLGYLETAFNGTVPGTYTYMYNVYDYLNLDIMIAKRLPPLSFAGGLYLGIGLSAWSYRAYTDEWLSLSSNGDLGLVGEVGLDVLSFLSVGVQGRFGLKSIGSSVDIRNSGLLLTITVHVLEF